ncbi:uncharacterized protein LOC110432416 isoform X4 [Sorghum bicolor]|uniref:uncharacterized protein LOC110432416 isoform X4 n=1 Tax=Sorghum bicolor TaxID=4558 RepID=UPI000B425C77|nr:uncharacterized protein LOC110432416 isoform X4 [Sorghum bicolor]|eukprot:XP_021308476.1 uncharacterized protein LOC110432416 isoform X4 [Sorghum bicolor]
MVNLVCANFGNDSWRFGYILVNFWSRPHPALFPVRSARGSLLFLVLVSGAGSQVRWRLSQFCYQRRALRRRACSLEQHLSLARSRPCSISSKQLVDTSSPSGVHQARSALSSTRSASRFYLP